MKRTFVAILLLLGVLTALHVGYRLTIGARAHAQDPSLYLDPKTGEERLVDTTIVSGSQIGFPFENTTNHFSSSFADVLKEKEMVKIGKLEESFTFGIPFSQSFGTLSPAGKPTTKGNTITYPKVWGGTDLKYTVTPERLLEELIVPTREEAGKIGDFTQTLNLGKLTARKNDDGSITILKDNAGVIFTIPKPLLYELNNKKDSHDGVVYELTSEIGGTKLTKRVTEEGKKWLTDGRRHYPVVIDAAVTVATSTSASAIGNSFQSKIIFNPATSNYWSFYYDGSAIAYASSTDGVTWTVRGSFAYNTFHFALTQRDSTSTVFLSTQCGSDLDICVRKGTIAGTIITWTNEVVALDGTDATTDAYTRPNIALSRDGYIWVAARKQTAASTFISTVRKSTNVEDPAAWGTASSVGNSETYLLDHILVPTNYNNMYLVANGGSGDRSVVGYAFNGSTWTSAVTGGEGGSGGGWSGLSGTEAIGQGVSPAAMIVIGQNLYVGGTGIETIGGANAQGVVMYNGTSWSKVGTGISGIVSALATIGTDLYVAGLITNAGGVAVNNIAKWNGTSWSALGGGLTGGSPTSLVNTLSVYGTTLVAGGLFTIADGVEVNFVAKWNGTSWSEYSVTGTNIGTWGPVQALLFKGSDLYVSGSFDQIGGLRVNNIAKWNGTSWSAVGGGLSGQSNALATDGTNIYAGGQFSQAEGVTVNYVAKWNGTSWSALGGGTTSMTYALAVIGTDLYAAGQTFIAGDGTTTIRYLAKWNGTSWSAVGTASGFNWDVYSLTASGTDLYAGGHFSTAGGVAVNGIAKWNGTSWSGFGAGTSTGGVWSIFVVSSSEIYIGGDFSMSSVPASLAAKWNGTSWSAFGAGVGFWVAPPGVTRVSAITVIGTDVYAGGDFTKVDGVIVNGIAKWNGTSWSALGAGVDRGQNNFSLVVSGTNLIAGGWFISAGGVTVNYIAKWNGTSWSPGASSTVTVKGVNGQVQSSVFDGGGNLYIGGSFIISGVTRTNYIAKWNGTDWSSLQSGLGYIYPNSLVFIGTNLYASGSFTSAGGVATNYIAKWNGTSWSGLANGGLNTLSKLASNGTNLMVGGVTQTSDGLVKLNGLGNWDGTSWSLFANANILSGGVNVIYSSGTNLYVGGGFTTVSGMSAPNIAKWNGTSWSALWPQLGMDSPGSYLAASGSNIYLAGQFTQVGGVAVNNIAMWNGTSWSSMGGGANNQIQSITASGTDVIVGGFFTTIGGVAATGIAKWNGTSWSAMGTGISGNIYSLKIVGPDVVAGGSFTTAGGVTVNYIAKWNGTSWSGYGSLGPVNGLNSNVYSIVSIGSNHYFAGDFSIPGSSPLIYRIGKWNGTSWSALGTTGTPYANSYVYSLATDGTNLYAGGAFASIDGVTVNRIAKWNGTSWSALGGGVNGTVNTLVVSGTDIYAGGSFTTAGGVTVNRIAKWNGTSWSAMGSGTNATVLRVAVSGTDIYAGGSFTTAGGVTVNYVAKWNGTSWSALGGGMNNSVAALAVSGMDIYAGGSFTTADGVTVNYIAKWNGTSWSAMGSGTNATVLRVAVSGTDIYAGGAFTTANGVTVNYVAKWNGTSWSAMGSGTLNNVVRDFNFSGGNLLYIGGSFQGGQFNYIAKWNGSDFENVTYLDTITGTNNGIYTLEVNGTDIYAGGAFTTANGVTVNYVAKWNGTSWSALGGGMNGQVYSLATDGTNLYAGGTFTIAGGVTVNRVAKWNGTSWSALGSGLGETNMYVNNMVFLGTNLYAGGNFTTAGGVTVNYIAKWNGTSWSAMGSGLNITPPNFIGMIKSGTQIYVAGYSPGNPLSRYSTWSEPVAGNIANSASTAQEIATVSDFSDVTHLLYVDGNADVKYKKYSGGSWGTAVTLLTGTATNPSIAINKANGDLYAFWMEGSTINYKKGVAPYGSGNWDASPTTFYNTGTNATISTGSRWDGVFLQWTNGTGNPYGVLFDKLSAGTSQCIPPPGGALYVESNCAVTGTVGGADDGDLLITSGQAFTVNAGQTITWGPGKSITIPTGGSIILSNTGTLKQTNMWMVDADGDGYPASTTITAQTNTPGGTYVRRKSLQTYTATDSNDADASVH